MHKTKKEKHAHIKGRRNPSGVKHRHVKKDSTQHPPRTIPRPTYPRTTPTPAAKDNPQTTVINHKHWQEDLSNLLPIPLNM
jgi:hypothetical protein